MAQPQGALLEARRALGARTVDEVLAAYDGRPLFVVEGVVHVAATLVFGASGGGKTWLTASLVAAVASGRPWFGRTVDGPRDCIILAADPDGEREYAERVASYLPGAGRDRVLITVPPRPEQLEWQALAQHLLDCGTGLVVIDNLYSWAGEVDIIKNAEVARPLACVRALTDLGIPVVLVHHTSQGGKKAAGVHSIPAFFRHQVFVAQDRLETSGNSTATDTVWVTREAGRIVDVHGERPAISVDGPLPEHGQRRPTARADDKRRRAHGLLEQAPQLSSDHERGAYLAESMPDVATPEAGRGLVRRMRKAGWTPPGTE
nr:AAA family ATPase [Geodermatophilus normandii]